VEEQLIKELTNNGDVTDDAIDPLYPGSLFKLPRFVARGLENLGIAPSLCEDIGVTTDSPSGGGLGPVGIKENSGFCSFLSSKRGKPIPGLAQFTFESSPLKASATGETRFSEGKMHSLHVGHV